MVPVGKQRAERGYQRDGLVEHDVMPGDGYLDDRGHPAKPVVDAVAHLRGQDAVLCPEEGRAAVQLPQRRAWRIPAVEDGRVPLPRPPVLALADRHAGDMIGDVADYRLVGDRTEAGENRLPRRVAAQLPEDTLAARRLLLGSRVAQRGVDDHRALDVRPE